MSGSGACAWSLPPVTPTRCTRLMASVHSCILNAGWSDHDPSPPPERPEFHAYDSHASRIRIGRASAGAQAPFHRLATATVFVERVRRDAEPAGMAKGFVTVI